MYIIKNALKSISRSKGRNVLMGIIVLVIAISTCVALSIKEAAKEAKEDLLDSVEITAQISVDRKSMMESAMAEGEVDREAMKELISNISSLSIEEMLTYAEADSVKDFYYTITASLDGTDTLVAIDSTDSDSNDTETDTSNQTKMPSGENESSISNKPGSGRMGTQGDFTLIGYSSDSAMTDFINGVCTITDGKIFDEGTTENVCVVSDELALYNSINIGDTISLTNPNNEDELIQLTVVGIYNNSESTTNSESVMGGFMASTDSANQIYMSYNALNTIINNSQANAVVETDESGNTTQSTALRSQVSGTYTFADIVSYENFQTQARELGLSESYTISSSDLLEYESSLTPLENLSKFATYFFVIVLVVGGIILVVLNLFNIRERKYEIGVLTAIGMKKGKVAFQFVCELFIVTIASIIIGTCAGAAVSLPVTNSLLESQVTAQQEESSSIENSFGRDLDMSGRGMQSQSSTVDYITEVSSATDIVVVMQLMGIGILLTLVSSLIAVVFILRYEPLKILTSRD